MASEPPADEPAADEIPDETHLGDDGLHIPAPLRDLDHQVVFRTPRSTVQHIVKVKGPGESASLDAYYALIDESHFGPVDSFDDPKNPELAPDRVSIAHMGEEPVVLTVRPAWTMTEVPDAE